METRIPNNSDAARNAKKEDTHVVAKPVVQAKVKHRKSLGKLLRQTFIPEDVNDAGDYILSEIIMPSVKNGFFDTVMNIVDYWRGGNGTSSRRSSGGVIAPRPRIGQNYNYNRISTPNNTGRDAAAPNTNGYSYDDILIQDYPANAGGSAKARADAEAVLVSMQDLIDRYSVVRILDLYDLVGLTGTPSDYSYGWTNLNGARVERANGGWLLVLPKAMPIDTI